MTLKEIYKLALNRCGEQEGNRQVESILINGINAACKLIATRDKTTKTVVMNFVKNIPVKVPSDLISFVMLLKTGINGGILSDNDYYITSDFIMISDPDLTGDVSLVYNYIPTDLTLLNDSLTSPAVRSVFHSALAAYACYYYYLLRGNSTLANVCYQEFTEISGITTPKQTQQSAQ